MARLLAVATACLLLSSCVAEMVTKSSPRKGPVREVGYVDTGGGDVRYSTDGWGWVIAMRRSMALKRVRGVCGELKPKIVDEFTHDDVEATYTGDDMSELAKGVDHFEVAPYHHILFECAPPVELAGAKKK